MGHVFNQLSPWTPARGSTREGGGASGSTEVAWIRWVRSFGVRVMVTALAPVVLGGYDIGGRKTWLPWSARVGRLVDG